MKKVDETTKELRNNGVVWKELGEIGKFIRGSGLQKKDFTNSGVGCIHYGQIHSHYKTYTDKTLSFVSEEHAKKLKKAKKGDLIIATTSEDVEGVCKAVAWLGAEDIAVGGHSYVFKHDQNAKYMAYMFRTRMFNNHKKKYATGAKVIEISGDNIAKFSAPIPSLDEQERVVSILDKYETLVNELSTNVSSEIEARRKQYGYYLNQLLTPVEMEGKWYLNGKEVEWMILDDLCLNTKNINWNSAIDIDYQYIDLSSVSREDNQITETGTINFRKAPSRAKQIVEKGDVIFGTTRPTLQRCAIITEDLHDQICSTGFCVLRPNTKMIIPEYLFYTIITDSFRKYVEAHQKGTSYPSISDRTVKKYAIPVVSLDEQYRIVSILDRYEALINELSTHVSYEIEARQRQFDYYLNKLLSFSNIADKKDE